MPCPKLGRWWSRWDLCVRCRSNGNPVPDLHLDISQKIKTLGFNDVSFYVDWARSKAMICEAVYRMEDLCKATVM
jgi:hypothetical protein